MATPTDTNQTSYFVTGANRGIGYGIVSRLASRPNTTVYATTRSKPDAPSELTLLAKSHPNVHILKLETTSVADAKAAAEYVKKTTGKLDVLIANAAIADAYHKIVDTPLQKFRDHFEVNSLGPVIIFQALYPLLRLSPHPKFIPISSGAGTITNKFNFPVSAYGTSKAALNFITVSIHSEHAHEGLVAFPLNPGWVQTDMGNKGAETLLGEGKKADLTLEESVTGILKVVDAATVETHGGKFFSYDGSQLNF